MKAALAVAVVAVAVALGALAWASTQADEDVTRPEGGDPSADPDVDADREPAPALVGLAAGGTVVLGAVTCAVFRTDRRARSSDPNPSATGVPTPGPMAEPAGPAPIGDPGLERLVEQVIGVRDLANPALAERLGAGLAAVGWETVDPAGQPFDPSRHRAVDTAEVTDGAEAGTIAAVERVGYLRSGTIVRPAEVVFYKEHP
jgi:hypothetical protein